MNFAMQLNRFLEPIRVRLRMLVNRAIITLVNDTTRIQLMQIELMQDEIKDNVERVQNYGLTSNPVTGCEAVVVFPSGNRDHGLIVAVDDSRYRLKDLPEGGVALYDYDNNYVKLTKTNGIEIEAPNQNVTIKASGDIEIGNANLKKLVTEEVNSLFNAHVHSGIGLSGTTVCPAGAGTCTITAGNVLSTTTPMGSGHLTDKLKAE